MLLLAVEVAAGKVVLDLAGCQEQVDSLDILDKPLLLVQNF